MRTSLATDMTQSKNIREAVAQVRSHETTTDETSIDDVLASKSTAKLLSAGADDSVSLPIVGQEAVLISEDGDPAENFQVRIVCVPTGDVRSTP